MHLQRLSAEEAAVRRYVEELWLPFHRDLEAAVADHELADDVDNDRALAFYEKQGFDVLRQTLAVPVEDFGQRN